MISGLISSIFKMVVLILILAILAGIVVVYLSITYSTPPVVERVISEDDFELKEF